jgi:hypothetical protein
MSMQPELEDAVRDLVLSAPSLSSAQFSADFESIVQMWTEADAADPNSHGGVINGRHLAVVEAFYGASYEQMNGAGASINRIATITLRRRISRQSMN